MVAISPVVDDAPFPLNEREFFKLFWRLQSNEAPHRPFVVPYTAAQGGSEWSPGETSSQKSYALGAEVSFRIKQSYRSMLNMGGAVFLFWDDF